CTVRLQRGTHMGRGADGVAHIVQRIEDRHEIVALARIVFGRGDLKAYPVGNPCLSRTRPRRFDRCLVVIEAREVGVWVGLGHQDGRGAVAAANVDYARSGLELSFDAIERRDPARHKVGGIAAAEKALDAVEELVLMLVPAHALTAYKG